MDPKELGRLFGLNAYCVKVNTEGFTQADSLVQPAPDGNCANWVLGHIVATRQSILRILGRQPIWSDSEVGLYKRGSSAMVDSSRAMPFEKILSDFGRTQEQILEALNGMSPAELAKAMGDESMGETLATLHFHEAYHTGQLGLLRRIVGKEGAIK